MTNYDKHGTYQDKRGKYRITSYDVYFKIMHVSKKYTKNLPTTNFAPMRVTPVHGGRPQAIKMALAEANRVWRTPTSYKIVVQKTKIVRRAAYNH